MNHGFYIGIIAFLIILILILFALFMSYYYDYKKLKTKNYIYNIEIKTLKNEDIEKLVDICKNNGYIYEVFQEYDGDITKRR